MDITEPVNLSKSILLCNAYNFFFAASKACLFPFLTLYLRALGLTATQTGIVIGCKTLVAFFFAPLWTQCAVKCRKRRLVLMFSIFMMAATYLSLTLIPNKKFDPKQCSKTLIPPNTSQLTPVTSFNGGNIASVSPTLATEIPTNVSNMSALHPTGNQTIASSTLAPMSTTEAKPKLSEEQLTNAKALLVKLGLSKYKVDLLEEKDIISIFKEMMEESTMRNLLKQKLTSKDIDFVEMIKGLKKKKKRELRSLEHKSDLNKNHKLVLKIKDTISSSLGIRIKRAINVTAILDTIKTNLSDMKQKVLQSAKDFTFIAVMIVLLVGEIFCSPVEKLADDFWFDFLEKIDELEKYGKHRVWCSIAYMTFPLIVTLIVDNTLCIFNMSLPSITFHFYSFAALLGLTFLLGFFYPISVDTKGKYKSKLLRGLGKTCCRLEGLLYSFTLLLTGMIYAAYYNFMFWIIEDLNGPEAVMGLCITLSTLAELPILVFSKEVINRIGNGGVVSVSLMLLALRTLYYSYLWTPWAVLPVELLHAMTHTALWCATLSNPGFSVNPTIDRSIRSILSSVYFGVGFSVGSIVAGCIYDLYGSQILFRCCAVVAIVWCPVFFVLQRCCYRPMEREIKYTKLLQADDQSEDDDDDMKDDWLENALKNR